MQSACSAASWAARRRAFCALARTVHRPQGSSPPVTFAHSVVATLSVPDLCCPTSLACASAAAVMQSVLLMSQTARFAGYYKRPGCVSTTFAATTGSPCRAPLLHSQRVLQAKAMFTPARQHSLSPRRPSSTTFTATCCSGSIYEPQAPCAAGIPRIC
jgi:hypothetical protein